MMTKKEMSEVMDKVFEECNSFRESGQNEYARDNEDAFGNFNRVSNAIKVDRKKVLMVYAMKHLDGILSYIDGHTSQREHVNGRINDFIVYLCLLRGMIQEEEAKANQEN